MSDNGDEIEIAKITLKEGKIFVKWGTGRLDYLSHALRVASLELDNAIIGQTAAKEASQIVKATNIVDGIKRK